jgi:ornithine cyclodeaminase
LGIKSYTEFPTEQGRSRTGSTITLFDDSTGRPVAFMDCQRITAVRTGAVTALFAREAADPASRVAVLIGAGAQARATLPPLLHVMPGIEEIVIQAPRREAVEALVAEHSDILAGRTARFCEDLAVDCARAQIVVGAAGPGGHGLISHDMLRPGALAVLVGYGLAGDVLPRADRVLATSEAQMHVTGRDLVGGNGDFPAVDAELPDLLMGRKPGRVHPDQIVFAYNSGLAATDVAVATVLYESARKEGRGARVPGF